MAVTDFFQQQLDYIFFFYGLAFILLAAVCIPMYRSGNRRLPWIWLGFFGLAHGIGEWLDLTAISIGDSLPFKILRLSLLAASFIFLTEFGRAGMKMLGKGPGKWIYIPLLIFGLSGGLAGISSMNATMRYAFALTGGLMAAWTLIRAAGMSRNGGSLLRLAGSAMVVYSLCAGAVVPPAAFPPASFFNQTAFASTFIIPVQLIRGTSAILLTATIWSYYQHSRPRYLYGISWNKTSHGIRLSLLLVTILATGWVFTQLFGNDIDQMVRGDLINQTSVAAEAVDFRRVERLNSAGGDGDETDYERLRQQLLGMKTANPAMVRLQLLSLADDNTAEVLVDTTSGPANSAASHLREGIPQEVSQVFSSGRAAIVGPFDSGQGPLLSGFDALHNHETGEILAVMEMDFEADHLNSMIAAYRLAPISITLLISLVVIGSFLTRQSLLESSGRISFSEAKLAEAQRLANLGSWTYDLETDEITCSKEMLQILGRERASFSYADFRESIQEEDEEKLDAAITEALANGGEIETELRLSRPNGASRHVIVKLEFRSGGRGQAGQILGTAHDITERKVMEDALRQSEQRMRLHVEQTPLGVIEWDTDFKVVSWNPAAARIFGYTEDEAKGRRIDFIVPPHIKPLANPIWRNLLSGRSTSENLTKDGRRIICDWYNTPLTTEDGGVMGVASLAEDITERIEAEEMLREMSLRDELTELNNRRGFMTLAAQQVKNATRFRQKVVLVYADLDGLKSINDTFGHDAGDRAIKDVADILRSCFRSTDVIARLGGDEFAALTLEKGEQDSAAILSRLEEKIRRHNAGGNRPYTLSISLGVTRYDPYNACSLEELLRRGDEAMYAQKLKKQRRTA